MSVLSVAEQKEAVAAATELATKVREHFKATGDAEGLALYRKAHVAARTLKEYMASSAGDDDVTTFGGTPTPPDDEG